LNPKGVVHPIFSKVSYNTLFMKPWKIFKMICADDFKEQFKYEKNISVPF